MTLIDLYSILPVLVLVIWALVTLLVEAWTYKRTPFLTPVLAVIGLVAALVLTLVQSRQYSSTFNEMIRVDVFGSVLNVLFCVSGILSIGIAYDYLKKAGIQQGEYYPLIMLSTGGMMLMATAGDLVEAGLALQIDILAQDAIEELRADLGQQATPGGGTDLVIHHLEFLPLPQQALHGEEEVLAIAAIDPTGAQDESRPVGLRNGLFAIQLALPIHAQRVGNVAFDIWAAFTAVEDVIG